MTWYAIRTAPQREFTVEAMLKIKGYDVFLPTETKLRKSVKKGRRVVREVTYPLFVRYLFVGGNFSWLHLMAERHVAGVVGFDGRPAPISDAEMRRLRAMSGSTIPHRHSVNPHKALRQGDLAEITHGQFIGTVAPVVEVRGQKAKIMMMLFGTERVVEVPTNSLEAA